MTRLRTTPMGHHQVLAASRHREQQELLKRPIREEAIRRGEQLAREGVSAQITGPLITFAEILIDEDAAG